MAQNNSNVSHVLDNTNSVINGTGGWSTGFVTKSGDPIGTILNSGNGGNLDNTLNPATYNDNYSLAVNYTDAVAAATRLNTATLLLNQVNGEGGEFLPTEQVAKAEWAAAGTVGSYFTAASWTTAPKLTGNASTFTLSNTGDGNKTLVLSENISGSPFTTGNGAVSEALTFRGTANDVLTVKHNVNVANIPATTNNNFGSALDVRNEAYAEGYAKQGVTSNYAWNTSHKYTEANSNQTLNDAFGETYAYKDADLTINSSVKTNLADSANINGAERIAESKVANYSYTHAKTGSVSYIVTDTRNLAQVDQRTWTNTTVTNVAKFEVVDKTNGTTITAKGLITGTTDNLSTAANNVLPTVFKSTGAEFKVDGAHYTLAVDAKEFDVDHAGVASNALLTLIDATSSTGDVFNSALGDVPAGQVSLADAFNPYISTVGAVAGARLDGTQFNDIITVKDSATAPFNATIDAKAGNDKITGGFGNDNINGGAGNDTIDGGAGDDKIDVSVAGADTIIVSAGNDTITGFELGTDSLTVTKGTGTAKVTITFADNTSAVYNVTGNATTDVTIPAAVKTKVDLEKIAGVAADRLNLVGTDNNDTLIGAAGDDSLNGGKGADTLTGNAGADTFKFSDLTNGIANRVDTITDFSATAGDKIDVSALGFKTFIGTAAFTPANETGALRFDDATHTLQGNTDANNANAKIDLAVILTGVTAADLSAGSFIFA
jgi:Ca2+-binding RTX toxin-like protein